MPEIIPKLDGAALPTSPPNPRSALFWDGTNWHVATVDGAGHIQIDVLSTVMDALAATAANQVTMITALELIDDLRNALDSVGTDELDVNVEASVLPLGAATDANQALILAQVQLIEDLRDALQSVNTDALQVRGEDQLFSFKDVLVVPLAGNPVGGAGGYLLTTVTAGEVWEITNVCFVDNTAGITQTLILLFDGADVARVGGETRAIPAAESVYWNGHFWADGGEAIRFYFIGCGAADNLELWITGYRMTKE